jgi:hypothetical protein
MTLFACVAESGSVFVRVLEKYFQGKLDVRTLQLLEKFKGNKDPNTNGAFCDLAVDAYKIRWGLVETACECIWG